MADTAIRAVRKYLNALQPDAALADAELLERYASHRDADAFAELVRRHGPMVLGVALRQLGNRADAEDAFQAAFLALARQAGSVRGMSAGAWLHRVTVRATCRARQRARTATLDNAVLQTGESDPLADAAWREVRGILDEELTALPDRLRDPLVLCYLEALTRDEAARRLGWPLRTLERRLQEGRDVLGSRLRRRGVSTAALAAATLSPSGLSAEVPGELAAATVRSGLGAVSGWGRWGVAGALLGGKTRALAVAAVITAAVLAGLQLAATGPAAPEPAPPAKGKADETRPVEAPDVPLPAGAVRRFGSMAWRHNGGISSAVLSADGKTLVTVSVSGTVAVWDAETGRRRHRFGGCDMPRFIDHAAVAVSPDGRRLACLAQNDVSARVWDLDKGVEVCTVGKRPPAQPWMNRAADFRQIHFSPDGAKVLVTDVASLAAYDAATGRELHQVALPGWVVAASADGKLFATHNFAKAISVVSLCDASTGKALRQLDGDIIPPGAQSWFLRIAFSPDGKLLATIANLAPEVCVWDTATGKQKGTYKRAKASGDGDDERLATVAFNGDGKTLLAGGLGLSSVRRWDLATGRELDPLRGHRGTVSALLPAPGGKLLYSTSDDCTIRRWEMPSGREIPLPDGFDGLAVAALSPDGRSVVTSNLTGRLSVWEAGSGRLRRTLSVGGEPSGATLTFAPDGKTFTAGRWNGKPAAVFDATSWKPRDNVRPPAELPLRFTPDGNRVLVSSMDNRFGLWDLAAGNFIWELSERVRAAALRLDGKVLAAATNNGISIRDTADGRERLLIPVSPHPDSMTPLPCRVDSVAFSPDGRLVACSRWDDGDIYVYDSATGRQVYRLVGHAMPDLFAVRPGHSAVAFSPDGHWLASGHNDGTVRLWEVATGKEAVKLSDHDAHVTALEFGPDSRTLLVTAGVEVLLRDLRPGADARAELPALWADLASDDAALAYRAMHRLAARGVPAVALLRKELKPVVVPDPAATARLIGDLESARFAVREKASKELQALGHSARPALRAALERKPSAEVQARVAELFKRLDLPPAGDDLRRLRAVQVLAWAGGDEARALLRALAGGAPGVPLTEAAARALQPVPGD